MSVWLGLRPKEVDQILDQKMYRIAKVGDTSVIWVFQTKLTSVPPDKRWKPIPLIYDEQVVLPLSSKED